MYNAMRLSSLQQLCSLAFVKFTDKHVSNCYILHAIMRARHYVSTYTAIVLLQSQSVCSAYVKTHTSACKSVKGDQTHSAFPPLVQPESVNSARQP